MTTRTLPQNASLHLYCEKMAEGLNNTQASVQKVCTIPIEWTKENFKYNIWRPVMTSLYPDVTSTTQLTTVQMNAVYEQVNKIIGDNWHVSEAWPSLDEQRIEGQGK